MEDRQNSRTTFCRYILFLFHPWAYFPSMQISKLVVSFDPPYSGSVLPFESEAKSAKKRELLERDCTFYTKSFLMRTQCRLSGVGFTKKATEHHQCLSTSIPFLKLYTVITNQLT